MGKIYVQGEVLNATDLNASFLELKTLPINPQTSTYTLVVDDLGKVISATGGGVNIPANVFASGGTVSIFNNSTAVINIIQAAGLTLYNASTGVAGSFTLNSRGICSVIFVNTTTAVLTGVGVSVTASGTLQGPVGPAGSLSAGTAKASTSGTSINFTGIPSYVKRITVMFSGVSTSGTSDIIIQLGTGTTPTYTVSGYLGTVSVQSGTADLFSTGFRIVNNNAAASVWHGNIVIVNVTSNTWSELSTLGNSNAAGTRTSGGTIPLAAVLTAIRITTSNGTDTFDAGTINILYE